MPNRSERTIASLIWPTTWSTLASTWGFISASRTRRRGGRGLASRRRRSITSCGRFTIAVTIMTRSAATTMMTTTGMIIMVVAATGTGRSDPTSSPERRKEQGREQGWFTNQACSRLVEASIVVSGSFSSPYIDRCPPHLYSQWIGRSTTESGAYRARNRHLAVGGDSDDRHTGVVVASRVRRST